MENLMNLI